MRRIAVGLVVAAMVLAACGGSSKSGSGSTSTTGGGGTAGNDFSGLLAKAKTANFKVTYTASDGKSETIAQDGQGKTAYITDSNITIDDGTKTISCDGTTATATCTDLGTSGASIMSGYLALFTSLYTGIAQLPSSVFAGHTSTDTIAGRDAKCATYKPSDLAGLGGAIGSAIAGKASVTACIDAQTGVLLKYGGTDQSGKETDELLATAAGESSPSDFVPPSTPATTETTAAPVTLPGGSTIPQITLPGGSTIPNLPGQ